MDTNLTLDKIKKQGGRMTGVRKAIVELLYSNHQLSVPVILEKLSLRGLAPNKTTVYREIEYLVGLGIVKELRLGSDSVQYELVDSDHHHHIVCTSCGISLVIETDVAENALNKLEKDLGKKSKFANVSHSLEFFGLCQKCKRI